MNPLQKVFYDKVTGMIHAKQSGMISLVAPGGTGKTYLACSILEHTFDTIMLAPTHKACSLYHNRGVECITIHRFLSAKRTYTADGEETYTFSKPFVKQLRAVLVDESSMISESMFKVFEELSEYLLVIFIGDDHQIPPVDEDHSIIFNNGIDTYTLTQNMRSRDSLSNHYLQLFRESVDTKRSPVIEMRTDVGYMLDDFKQGKDVVCLCYTNSKKNAYNKQIRQHLFTNGDSEPEEYYVKEKLVFSGFRATPSRRYHSNDIITIVELNRIEEYIPYERCKHQQQTKLLKKCDICNIKGHTNLGYDVDLWEVIDEYQTKWYMPRGERSKKKLNNLLNHRKQIVLSFPMNKRKDHWSNFYDWKDSYMPKLQYPYASTTHKAQGSEWDIVYVDLANMRIARDIQHKLSYTAVSRMKNEVRFL